MEGAVNHPMQVVVVVHMVAVKEGDVGYQLIVIKVPIMGGLVLGLGTREGTTEGEAE